MAIISCRIGHLMSRSSDDGWKNGSWRIVSSKTGLAHARSIVNYKSCYVVVTHFSVNAWKLNKIQIIEFTNVFKMAPGAIF